MPISRRNVFWQNRDFARLWAAHTVSVFGSLVSRTALPFGAILFLHATPGQMALLAMADIIPGFLAGLAAGVWVDRLRRRPLLLACDWGRAVLLATVPLAAWFHVLRIEQLYVVAFLGGVLTLVFEVASAAYLPGLVRPEQLAPANSALSAGASVAEFTGFSLSGWLVQWLGASFAALGLDAVTYAVSALCLGRIRGPEPSPAPPESGAQADIGREVREGLRAVWQNPLLRVLAGSSALLQFGSRVLGTVFLLYVTRTLGLSPGVQGLIYAVGGVTSLLGALAAERLGRRIGVGRVITLGVLVAGVGTLCLPFAPGLHAPVAGAALLTLACLLGNQLIADPAWTIYDIHETSLQQSVTPDRLRGRVGGSMRVLGLGAQILGALIGGVLGERIGLRTTVGVGAVLTLLPALWLAFSPVRRVRVIEDACAVPETVF